MGSGTIVVDDKKELVKGVHRFGHLGVQLENSPKGGFVVQHNSELF